MYQLGACVCGCGSNICGAAMVEATKELPGTPPFTGPAQGTQTYNPGDSTSNCPGAATAYEYMIAYWGDVDMTGDNADGSGNFGGGGSFDYGKQTRYRTMTILVESFEVYGTSSVPVYRSHTYTKSIDVLGLFRTISLSKSDDTSNGGTGPETYNSSMDSFGNTIIAPGSSGTVVADSAQALFGPASVNANPNGGKVTLTINETSGVYKATSTDPLGIGVDEWCQVTVTLSDAYTVDQCYNDALALMDTINLTSADQASGLHYQLDYFYQDSGPPAFGYEPVGPNHIRLAIIPDASVNGTVFKELALDQVGASVHVSKLIAYDPVDVCLVDAGLIGPFPDTGNPCIGQNFVVPYYSSPPVTFCSPHYVTCTSSGSINFRPDEEALFFVWGSLKLYGEGCVSGVGSPNCCDKAHVSPPTPYPGPC